MQVRQQNPVPHHDTGCGTGTVVNGSSSYVSSSGDVFSVYALPFYGVYVFSRLA